MHDLGRKHSDHPVPVSVGKRKVSYPSVYLDNPPPELHKTKAGAKVKFTGVAHVNSHNTTADDRGTHHTVSMDLQKMQVHDNDADDKPRRCANCGAKMKGLYCTSCGERA